SSIETGPEGTRGVATGTPGGASRGEPSTPALAWTPSAAAPTESSAVGPDAGPPPAVGPSGEPSIPAFDPETAAVAPTPSAEAEVSSAAASSAATEAAGLAASAVAAAEAFSEESPASGTGWPSAAPVTPSWGDPGPVGDAPSAGVAGLGSGATRDAPS